jgi:hypothetical protein
LLAIPLAWTADVSAARPQAARPIPFPAALEAAAVRQERLDDLLENSLILGNGDLNALLYASGRNFVFRLTKNDVWDARVDTSHDPPLMKVDVKNGKWTGGGSPQSWNNPYPCPRTCACLILGEDAWGGISWRPVRGEGRRNTWQSREGKAVMQIEGRPGASNGYACDLLDLPTDTYPELRVVVAGTANAKYYVDVMDAQGIVLSSKWIRTPEKPETRTFALPRGRKIETIILYTWTIDGKLAENRFSKLECVGPGDTKPLDLGRIDLPGEAVSSTLDLHRAAAQVKYPADRGDRLVARVLAGRNVLLIDSPVPGRIRPVPAPYLPAAKTGHTDNVNWILQDLPGDGDWPGMQFAVAEAWAAWSPHKAVAVVTSLEAKDCRAAACELARSTLAADQAALVREHEKIWESFWSTSGVALDDAELTRIWYRNLYFLRCVSKPGVEAVGLYAGLVDDNPNWHGSHTLNYNSEQTFWPAYITNHVDLAEPYERMISRYLPRARWYARETYNCGGAHFPHNVFAHETLDPAACRTRNHRMHAFSPYAQSLCVSGWAVQNLWLHWKYQPDREYLEKTAYPAVRDVAVFYADFMDQCPADAAGKVSLGPTFCPEHRGLGERDCTADLAFFRFTFRAAIEGAAVLGRDAELAGRLRRELDRLPDYPLYGKPDPIVTDVRGAAPIDYNIAVPVLPVFPANQVTWFSGDEQKQLFRRTIEKVQWNGYNSSIIMSVARARLGLPDTWSWVKREMQRRGRPNGTITLAAGDRCGHFTEQFAAAGAVSELLLQSVGDVLRVFPAWPREKAARFENLRAQGGFLVSAEQDRGQIAHVGVVSTVGGKLRLLSPWPAVRVEADQKTIARLQPDGKGIVEIETRAGEKVVLRPGG